MIEVLVYEDFLVISAHTHHHIKTTRTSSSSSSRLFVAFKAPANNVQATAPRICGNWHSSYPTASHPRLPMGIYKYFYAKHWKNEL